MTEAKNPRTVLTLFGTRPEIIKLAPVIRQLDLYPKRFRTVNVSSGQHTDLLAPFVKLFAVRVDHDLGVLRPGQPLSQLFARVLSEFDPILVKEKPDIVLVQGDTTTAVAGALAAFHRGIPVGHVEAGLRTDDPLNPFPEETNRRLITRIARYHFAATKRNVRALCHEGVSREDIFLTGNPVVDALQHIGTSMVRSPALEAVLEKTTGLRRIALTTHRRESFGGVLEGNLRVLRDFIESHPDVALIFPVHPNPMVREMADAVLGKLERVHLLDPLDYPDFIGMLSESWLIVSDSGGVQEEAPSLGKPLLVLRETTERPEAVEAGIAHLVTTPDELHTMLHEADAGRFGSSQRAITNPFGQGDSGQRIVRVLRRLLDPIDVFSP
ncbi:MAG: UDP-N-acetylglucosamine 2-epimerase (non-hydrolyzing) [Planctomycetes bacterium]|nr:UDP-N-acetylglucosamine 2-epimerase (non-hydrolyzing) [Planctomycetota bacterium]